MPSIDFEGMPGRPYEYQCRAFHSFFAEYDGAGRPQLIVMATGLGKSVTAALISREIVERRGGKVLVLAHLDNLISQLAEEFDAWGMPCAIEKAEMRARELADIGSTLARCVIGSVQTLKGKRLKGWKPDYFDLVIIDECHVGLDRFRAVLDHFSGAKRLGITATPNRSDKRNLGEVFEHKCFEYLLPEAIANGELCKLSIHQCDAGVDLGGLKTRRGESGDRDFDPAAIADRIGPHIEILAKAARAKLGPGQTLVFAPDRHSAQAFASAFTQLGISCASVDYKTADRREIIRAFKEGTMARPGDYAALANFGLLTTGFNHKPVGNIVMLRPTANESLIEQILGRGTRRCDGKDECRLIDFSWMIDGDRLARPVDLFMPRGADEATRKRAREIASTGDGIDPAEAARQAEAERLKAIEDAERKKAAREDAAKAREERKVKVHLRDANAPAKFRSRRPFDLFAVRSLSGLRPPEAAVGTVRMPATEGMKRRLKDLGIDNVADVSQREAEQIVSVWSDRKEAGMSSMRQVRFLTRQGYDVGRAMDMTVREANAAIGPLQAKFAARSRSGSG